MSFYKVSDSDINNYITSFNRSELFFCDCIRNAVNDVNCMGMMSGNVFFFEKYSNMPSIAFKNNVVIDYILNNTEEFCNEYAFNDENCDNFYIYYNNYVLKITSNLDMYKIMINGKTNSKISYYSDYCRVSRPVQNEFNFNSSYHIDNIGNLKKTIVNCLLNEYCDSLYIDGYCVFSISSDCSNNAHIINNLVVRNYVIDNVDCLFEYPDSKINIHMYDPGFIYRGHNISIVRNDDTFNINIYRETSGLNVEFENDSMSEVYYDTLEKSNMYNAMMSSYNYVFSRHNNTN